MNVHSLFSNRNESDDSDDDNNNNRYVGGVSSRGGGSGLAVEPNTSEPDSNSILSAIRANATSANAADAATGTNTNANTAPRRTITMYRSSFTVDNGPERRLDDPSNAEFLKDLARGIVPRELQEDHDDDDEDGNDDGNGSGDGAGETTVGLIDKRQMEYADDVAARSAGGGMGMGMGMGRGMSGGRSSEPSFSSFTGEGQSLGGSSTPAATGGVITPSTIDSDAQTPPAIDESSPKTMIQVRLLNGKRLRITINKHSKLVVLVQHIHASGVEYEGTEPYVLSAGFPPKILDDLERTVEECGLAGSQVIQKKA